MSTPQGTSSVAVEEVEVTPRGGSSRVGWSLKVAVVAALVCGGWFYVAQESFRQAAEAAFVRGQQSVAAALALRTDPSVARSLLKPRRAARWLAPVGHLPGVDYAFLLDGHGKVLAAVPAKEVPPEVVRAAGAGSGATGRGVWVGPAEGPRWLVVTRSLAKGGPTLAVARNNAALAAAVTRYRLEQAAWAAAIPAVLALVVFLITGSATRRILAVASRLQRVAQGYLDAKVPRVGGGEVGRLEAAFNSAVWSLKGRIEQGADDKYRRQREIRALEKALERLRSGDLQVQLEGSTVALKRVQAIFNLTVSELRAFLESLKQGAEETSDRARSLSAGAREAVLKTNESRIHADHLKRQLEELLAHIESALKAVAGEQEALAFLASITETGEGSVMQVVTDLYEKADEGARQVAHKVHGLAQQGMEIGKLTELIAEVAGQTNLLALNAALEASRAGEQGRGFAAVADEIRKLAVKITETAAEIQVMVETVTEDTGGALALIENTGSELSGNKVMVEAALASFKDLVESAKSARTHARAVEERLAAIEKDARDMHGATRQLGERASGATQALDAMADDLGVVTRIAEESVKRLKRLQLEAPDGGTPPEAAPEATGTTEATARRRAARAG